MTPPKNEKDPQDGGPGDLNSTLNNNNLQTTSSGSRDDLTRLAEDADRLLAEAFAFMDAADRVLCAALLDGVDLVAAAEHSVACQGRARRLLDMMFVREAMPV